MTDRAPLPSAMLRDPLASDPRVAGEDAPMSDEERAEAMARIREDLEREHSGRIERLSHWQTGRHASRTREAEISRLREEARVNFYKEKGYVRISEAGREKWVPPEEAQWRSKRRGGRPRRAGPPGRPNMTAIYVLLVVVAAAIGAMLVR